MFKRKQLARIYPLIEMCWPLSVFGILSLSGNLFGAINYLGLIERQSHARQRAFFPNFHESRNVSTRKQIKGRFSWMLFSPYPPHVRKNKFILIRNRFSCHIIVLGERSEVRTFKMSRWCWWQQNFCVRFFSLFHIISCFLLFYVLIKFTRWLSTSIVNCVLKIFSLIKLPRKTIDFPFCIFGAVVSCPCFLSLFSLQRWVIGFDIKANKKEHDFRGCETRTKNILLGLFEAELKVEENCKINGVFVLYLHECRLSKQSDCESWHQKRRCHIGWFLFHRKIQKILFEIRREKLPLRKI